MRAILDKKGEMSTSAVVGLIISVAVIAIAVYFIIFPTQFKTMLQNILPNVKNSANASYDVISGTDEAIPISQGAVMIVATKAEQPIPVSDEITPADLKPAEYPKGLIYSKCGDNDGYCLSLRAYEIYGYQFGAAYSFTPIKIKKSGQDLFLITEGKAIGYIARDGKISFRYEQSNNKYNIFPERIGWDISKDLVKKIISKDKDASTVLFLQYIGPNRGPLMDFSKLKIWTYNDFRSDISTNLFLSPTEYKEVFDAS
jgi:hypothetical protein